MFTKYIFQIANTKWSTWGRKLSILKYLVSVMKRVHQLERKINSSSAREECRAENCRLNKSDAKLSCYVLTLQVITPAALLLVFLDFIQESCFKALPNLLASFISAPMVRTCSDTELILNTSFGVVIRPEIWNKIKTWYIGIEASWSLLYFVLMRVHGKSTWFSMSLAFLY